MGLVNMLLQLPAGKKMLALPPEQNAPLESIMRQLRVQATEKLNIASKGRLNEDEIACHWRLVATYAKFMARAIKRQNETNKKSQLSSALMADMGINCDAINTPSKRFEGVNAFQAPPAIESDCMLQARDVCFAPWVTRGDYIKVDFTQTRLTKDSLYLVSVGIGYLAICGFHKGHDGWYVHESCDGRPRTVEMLEDRLPKEFQIIGLIRNVFEIKNPL